MIDFLLSVSVKGKHSYLYRVTQWPVLPAVGHNWGLTVGLCTIVDIDHHADLHPRFHRKIAHCVLSILSPKKER
jgi:hypothetical protein